MKMLKNILMGFRMLFTHYSVYASAIFTAVLCLCGAIYHDPIKNESYSAIKVLMEFDRKSMLDNTAFCSRQIIANINGSWLSMFLPVIAAFAFVTIVCDERESKAVRNTVFRSSRTGYYASRFVMICLSGGIAVLLGFALFAGVIGVTFPDINQYSLELQEQIRNSLGYLGPDFSEPHLFFLIGQKFLVMFLYGFVSAAPAALLTSILRNKYLILCIPFFMKYVCTQICEKLISQALVNRESPDMNFLGLVRILSPDSISNLFQSGNKIYIMFYHFGLVAVAFVSYMLIWNRRFDSGE